MNDHLRGHLYLKRSKNQVHSCLKLGRLCLVNLFQKPGDIIEYLKRKVGR